MKPHEETWEARGEDVWCPTQRLTVAREMVEEDAKLVAQAPAMARLLLSLGAMTLRDDAGQTVGYACCWCEAETRTTDPMTPDEARDCVEHLHDCRLVAVLRAAGVLE